MNASAFALKAMGLREPITAETGEAVSGAIKVLRGGGDAPQGDPSRLAPQYFKEAVQNMADEGRAPFRPGSLRVISPKTRTLRQKGEAKLGRVFCLNRLRTMSPCTNNPAGKYRAPTLPSEKCRTSWASMRKPMDNRPLLRSCRPLLRLLPPKPARSKPGQDHIKASDHVELRQPSGERRRATGMRVLLPSSLAEARLLSKSAGVALRRRSKKTGDVGEPPKDPEKKQA